MGSLTLVDSRPEVSRAPYVHGMRLAGSSCKGFMCISACGRVAGLAGRFIVYTVLELWECAG